jgi:hypothetical protein
MIHDSERVNYIEWPLPGPGHVTFRPPLHPDATSVAAFVDARCLIILLCRAALLASAFFMHLLLNAMCFALQVGHFSSM